MKPVIDRQKVNARAQLSNLASIGGLVLLLASVILPLFLPRWASFSFALMAVGLGTAMVGIYFANRWVRRPRPEAQLDKALKPLNDSHHLYHYPSLPCDHILLTPTGVLVLETVSIAGEFFYRAGRWKEAMTIGRALRYIVEEHLGDPIRAARQTEGYLQRRFHELVKGETTIPVRSLVVFTHPGAVLEIDQAPIPVCKADKLRKQVVIQGPKLDAQIYEQLDAFLEQATLKR